MNYLYSWKLRNSTHCFTLVNEIKRWYLQPGQRVKGLMAGRSYSTSEKKDKIQMDEQWLVGFISGF